MSLLKKSIFSTLTIIIKKYYNKRLFVFSFIKNNLKKIYSTLTQKLHTLFGTATLNDATISELKKILLQADTGVQTTEKIISHLQGLFRAGKISVGSDLYTALQEYLITLVEKTSPADADIYILVGINGSGKTTFCAKLAQHLGQDDTKIILVAADTFRAGAVAQLSEWAEKTNTLLVQGLPGQDPASVVFTGCTELAKHHQTKMIVDTAGRLQTKEHLMRELEKIKRVIAKQCPDKTIKTLLTVDAMLGQNSFEQAKLFHESVHLDGIILTKLDGTGKGGIIFSIVDQLQLPILFISFGEKITDIKPFDAHTFVQELLHS